MKLTAVWGSSGGGKSTVALALAATFVREKEDTLVIGMDSCTPSLPVYLPRTTDLTGNQSIGSLLEQKTITESALKDRIHRHPKSDRLFFMGYVSGEAAPIAYKPPDRSAIAALIRLFQGTPFRHVILDCMANPVYDNFTLFALEAADAVVRVITPDVKGYEFQKAQLAWLDSSDVFHPERHIRVCNLACPFSPLEEAGALCGGFHFSLPYARQVTERMMAGELLSGFSELTALRFENEIGRLAAKIEEVKENAQ